MESVRKVRMKRAVQVTIVRDLDPGDVVELPTAQADQYLANDIADPVASDKPQRGLEAAALAGAQKRG